MLQLNLRNKLLFFAIALAIIPLGLAGRTMIRITQDELKSSVNDELNFTAEQLAGDIDTWYRNVWLAPLLMLRNAIDDERLGVEEKVALLTLGIKDLGDIVGLQITVDSDTNPIVAVKEAFQTRLSEAGLDPVEVMALTREQLTSYFGTTNESVGELTYIPETDGRPHRNTHTISPVKSNPLTPGHYRASRSTAA
ncbi:hypothetical protein C2W62_40805 [Candidatus Entotheonella serta]|nr:hypothetical protein C2W62_40805 [Candidatus Entotheonella serta]